MTEADRMRGQLESLELVYADLTEGRPLVTAQNGSLYAFDDGAEARSLPDAVTQGRALVRFAVNQVKQDLGRRPTA